MSTDAVCPECRAQDWDETIDEIAVVCHSCGYVVKEFPVEQPPTDSRTTVEPPQTEPEPDTSWADTYTVASGTEQQVGQALEQLEAIADDLRWDAPVREAAAEILGQAAKQRVTDGRPIDRVVAAVLYLAGKDERRPRPLERVARSIGTDPDTLTHTMRVVQREVALDQPMCSATAYLPFLIEEREYSEGVEQRAAALVETVEQTRQVSGTSPPGLAAAAVYEASDGAVSQRNLAYDAGVSTETIRVRLHDIRHRSASE